MWFSCVDRRGVDEDQAREEGGALFEVTGYQILNSGDEAEAGPRQTKHFKYLTKNVVLATGQLKNTLPNRITN